MTVDSGRPWERALEPASFGGEAEGDPAAPTNRRGVLRGVAVAAGAITTGALTARGAMGTTPDGPIRPSFPHAFHGVSVLVPGIHRAVAFYTRMLGANVLVPAAPVTRSSVAGARLAALSGGRARAAERACLSLANGVGLELFEVAGLGADDGQSLTAGALHLAVTDPDVDAFVAEVEQLGGARLGATIKVAEGDGHARAFVRDPFGITLEVVSVSVEQALANLG